MTREEIVAEIANVPEEKLDELYRVVKHLESAQPEAASDLSTMARLRQIRISAAPDLSTKANLYSLERDDAE